MLAIAVGDLAVYVELGDVVVGGVRRWRLEGTPPCCVKSRDERPHLGGASGTWPKRSVDGVNDPCSASCQVSTVLECPGPSPKNTLD